MRPSYLLLFGLFIFGGWSQLSAQGVTPEQPTGSYAARYLDVVSDQATVFYGREQEPYRVAMSNHPYLKDSKYAGGRLSYRGVDYSGIPLRMDLNRDELIVLSPGRQSNVVLNGEEIDFAELHGYRIIYLHKDSLAGCPPEGFYMSLYSGQCMVLEKQSGSVQQKSYQQRIESYFSMTVKYYLRKDGTYFQIKNRKTLLKALGAHKNELERFIQANGFNFSKDAEKMLIAVVEEFEKLSHP